MLSLGDGRPYPGVAELTRQLDQEKIDSLTKRVDALRSDNDVLKTEILKSQKDTHEFVAYFQREVRTQLERQCAFPHM
jgi:hypothetical protein